MEPSRTEDLATRSVEAVLKDHLRERSEGNLDADLERNYSDKVVVLTPTRVYRGHDGVRECAGLLYQAIKEARTYEYTSLVTADRTGLLEWHANGAEMTIADGVDSFLVEEGRICVQTIRYTVTFDDLSQAYGEHSRKSA